MKLLNHFYPMSDIEIMLKIQKDDNKYKYIE